jgi:hypothetical protein
MGVSRVDYDNETLIDLSNDTVTPQTLAKGYTAHNSNGEPIVGTLVPEGGTGSGIIDVTELPTSNIDENAVYRVTESIQTEKTEIYAVSNGLVLTLQNYLVALGIPTVPNIYEVDELPADMKVSDVQTFSELHVYILRSDGIGYLNVPAYGGIITAGLVTFQAMGFDKGSTDDIYAETETGVYTTLATYETVVSYFIRENGEWKRISADKQSKTVEVFNYGITEVKPDEGKVFASVSVDVKTPCMGDFIDGQLKEVIEEHFRKSDGNYCYFANESFAGFSYLKKATIHKDVKNMDGTFNHCTSLETVTFKGKPNYMSTAIFVGCPVLTTINVPWSEAEIANAPWGAENATINYNYTGG